MIAIITIALPVALTIRRQPRPQPHDVEVVVIERTRVGRQTHAKNQITTETDTNTIYKTTKHSV